ncbi:MAG: glycogen debranching protein [Planctomycetota bacterium]|nr:MAG: glycogen debranching protein [Planctomycetota bacterium]
MSTPPAEPDVLFRMEREECLQLESSLTREWLETNGRGGYASGTVLACPTRRYHGLLVVTPAGMERRHVLVAGIDESLHGRSRSFPLSMLRYAGQWFPHGHQGIERFELAPWPRFVYHIGEAEVTRELMMVRGRDVTLVRYRIRGLAHTVELRAKPLLACREADKLTSANVDLNPRAERHGRGIACRPYGSLPAVAITTNASEWRFEADPVWYRGLEYQVDLARGYDGHEDQFSPGVLHIAMPPDTDVVLAIAAGGHVSDPLALWNEESARRRARARAVAPGAFGTLELAADAFLYEAPALGGGTRTGVMAGYPWFGEWGRDTCIALPGLLLARASDQPAQVERCGAALESIAQYLRDGLLPNIFGRTIETSHYGSADASLWFARAVRLYELAGGSRERVLDALLPALRSIAHAYRDGTRLGLRCDAEGLLLAGSASQNATWMDAVTSAGPVTPRHGYAVELCALWYQLLGVLEMLEHRAGSNALARPWQELRRSCGRAFLRRFWLDEQRYLADVVRDEPPHGAWTDTSVRPNMVIAAALELSPLSRGKRTDIVKRAEAELVTPCGLRTLAPKNPAYRGRYGGTSDERDLAYHQGTVWPWLLGFHVEAALRAYGPRPERVAALRGLLDSALEPLFRQGLGQISEVCDGDPPHRPDGCIAQAWSVAELLRAHALLDATGVAPRGAAGAAR